MDLFFPDFLTYGLYYITVLAILFAAGFGIDFLVNKDKEFSPERYNRILLLGLVSVLPIFALIITRGRSILFIALALLVIYCICNRKTSKHPFEYRKKYGNATLIVTYALLGIFCYLFTYWLFFVHTGGNIFCDQYFYANVSANLIDSHTECTDLVNANSMANPYHYGDLWLTAFGVRLFEGNAVFMLICISYSIFLYLTLTAAINTISKLFKENGLLPIIIYAFAFLFFTPIVSFFYPWGDTINVSKYLVLSFFFWTTAGYLLDRDYESAAFCSLLSIPFYSTVAPGVLVFTFLLGWATSEKKGTFKRLLNKSSILSVAVFLAYCIFYLLNKAPGADETVTVQPGNIWTNTILFTIKRSLRIIILMIPSFVALLFLYHHTNKKYPKEYLRITLIILISVIISNTISGFIRNFHIDGGQIATNYYTTAGWIFIYISFLTAMNIAIQGIRTKRKERSAISLCSIITLLYVGYFFLTQHSTFSFRETSEEETEAYALLKKEFEGKKDLTFGYFRNYEIDENHNTQKTRSYMFFPMERIALVKSDGKYFAHCLSSLDLPDDTQPIWDDHKGTGIYHYCETHPEISDEQCIGEYIMATNIDYIIIENGATLPKFLEEKVKRICSYDGNICYAVI